VTIRGPPWSPSSPSFRNPAPLSFSSGFVRDLLGGGPPGGATLPPVPPARGRGARIQHLSAGVVAHNEESNLEESVHSLLDQRLPNGVGWRSLWIVASGCTDRTVEVARRLTTVDPRVRLVEEAERYGKARALRQVFVRAEGDALVLLNADARADSGAVGALVRAAASVPDGEPYAVMGRPSPRWPSGEQRWAGLIEFLWDLHHRFHLELEQEGGGAHLSDELLLLSLPVLAPLPPRIVNDGSYLGVWLALHGGSRRYAPEARVVTQAPERLREHFGQRRRIYYGNLEVQRELGTFPTTIVTRSLSRPAWALRFLLDQARSRPRGLRRTIALGTIELGAAAVALWDSLPPRKDHLHWRRIGQRREGFAALRSNSPGIPGSRRAARESPSVEARVAVLTRLAALFGTELSLNELVRLLPSAAPGSATELQAWLSDRPGLATHTRPAAIPPAFGRSDFQERRARGVAYLARASGLLRGPLARTRPWVRCLAVSGSAAYGEPQAGDDLDLLVVSRTGSVWWFLAYAYLLGRLERWRGVETGGPTLCYNYVVEERAIAQDFARGSGLLFAREALSVRCLWGEPHYRTLLDSARWMSLLLPRLYAERTGGPRATGGPPAPRVVRALNGIVYPWLAAYLQLTGLLRNWRFRRTGRLSDRFRTTTGFRRLTIASARFDQLRRLYEEAHPQSHTATPSQG
jgi:glycosyltransferase involved in cell wall biosynthesis